MQVGFLRAFCAHTVRHVVGRSVGRLVVKTDESTGWLYERVLCTHGEACSQPRSKTVHDAIGDMVLDSDTGRPIHLGETAIFDWLKSSWAARQVALTHIAAATAIGAVENEAE